METSRVEMGRIYCNSGTRDTIYHLILDASQTYFARREKNRFEPGGNLQLAKKDHGFLNLKSRGLDELMFLMLDLNVPYTLDIACHNVLSGEHMLNNELIPAFGSKHHIVRFNVIHPRHLIERT